MHGVPFFSPLSGCCVNSGRWEGEEIWICCFGTSGVFIFRWLGLGELRSFTFQIQKNVNFKNFIFLGFYVLQFFCFFFSSGQRSALGLVGFVLSFLL